MKMTFLKSTMSIMAITALLAFTVLSCSKKKEEVGPENGKDYSLNSANGRAGLRTSSCEECCIEENEIHVTGDESGLINGVFDPFEPLYLDLCSGGYSKDSLDYPNAQLKLHDYFNSHVTGINGWKLAYIGDSTCSCIDDYSCAYIRSNYSTAGICSNTLGRNNTPGSSCVGWFDYQSPGLFKKVRCIIVWKDDCTPNGAIDAGEIAYVLCISNATPVTVGTTYHAEVDLSYKCCTVE